MQNVESGTPVNLDASGVVSKTRGNLLGFYVNNTAGDTIVIHDHASAASNAISGTITPVIGFNEFAAYCVNGCYADIAGGEGFNVTFFFAAG